MAFEEISHRGTIEKVDGHHVVLRLHHEKEGHDCHGCTLYGVCKPDSDDRHRLTITTTDTSHLHPGMSVRATVTGIAHWLAIVLTLVIPIILFTGLVVGLDITRLPHWSHVAIGFGAVGLWYGLLWLRRSHISDIIEWKITEDRPELT